MYEPIPTILKYLFSFPWMLFVAVCKWTWKKIIFSSIQFIIEHLHVFPMNNNYALHMTYELGTIFPWMYVLFVICLR